MRKMLQLGRHPKARDPSGRTAHISLSEQWPLRAATAAVLYTLFALCLQPAKAQSGHERWHQYYLHWKQPGTTISCCNARQTMPWGAETGDCEPTRYELRNGDWYAWLRQEQRWLKVPDNKLIRERNPSGEEGHLCAVQQMGQWVILCAVPPDTGI